MDSKPIYKTAAELGIEQWEHDGLAALVGPLSRGKLDFHMQMTVPECGSPGCIGGWLGYLHAPKGTDAGDTLFNALRKGSPLGPLFYPHLEYHGNSRCEAAIRCGEGVKAACAIINFLVTGDPRWDAVMATP